MIRPKKPRKPSTPVKPRTPVKEYQQMCMMFELQGFLHGEMSKSELLDKIKSIKFDKVSFERDYEGTEIVFFENKTLNNDMYDRDMRLYEDKIKRYDNQVKIYKKKMRKYNFAIKVWEEEMVVYNEWIEKEKLKTKREQFEKLRAELGEV